MNDLKEYKLEMKIQSVMKPSENEMYDAIRKYFHLIKKTNNIMRIDKDWLSIRQVESSLELLLR